MRRYGIAVAFFLFFLNAWGDFSSFADVLEHLNVMWFNIKAFQMGFLRGGET